MMRIDGFRGFLHLLNLEGFQNLLGFVCQKEAFRRIKLKIGVIRFIFVSAFFFGSGMMRMNGFRGFLATGLNLGGFDIRV